MNDETKHKLIMMLAMFATFILVIKYFDVQQQALLERQKREKALQQQKEANAEQSDKSSATREAGRAENVTGNPNATPSGTNATDETAETARPVAEAPAETLAAAVIDNIVVRGERGDKGGFEAIFTSAGAGLKRYRLLDYYRTPHNSPDSQLPLLDNLDGGTYSLVIETVGEKSTPGAAAAANYALVSAPETAELPESAAGTARNADGLLVFQAMIDNWRFTKTFEFSDKLPLGFRLNVRADNLAPTSRKLAYVLRGPCGIVPDDSNRWSLLNGMSGALRGGGAADVARLQIPMIYRQKWMGFVQKSEAEYEANVIDGLKQRAEDPRSDIAWVGVKNRFFTAVLAADNPAVSLRSDLKALRISDDFRAANPSLAAILKEHALTAASSLTVSQQVAGGASVTDGYRFYGGPADENRLSFDPRFGNLISYTWSYFDGISRFLVRLLDWIALITRNYGVGVILLTLLVKTVMHPLTRKSLRSGQKMQKLAPLIKELQRKYKDQRERMSQEMMRLYREHGVSPASGCLPMLIQLPIFLALYGCFSCGFSMRHKPFIHGWIDDLAAPDSLWSWKTPLPVVEWTTLSLLPIIYVILNVIQMSMQPKSDDPQVQQQQKMMKFMPVMFFFLFYTMPSGLVLYFAISSIYTLVEHWLIKRRIALEEAAAAGTTMLTADGKTAPTAPAAGVGISQLASKQNKKKKKG